MSGRSPVNQYTRRGLHNESLQVEVLSKAESLQSLDSVIKYAQSFESAQRDQQKLQKSAEVMAARASRLTLNNTEDVWNTRDDADQYEADHSEVMAAKSTYRRQNNDIRSQTTQSSKSNKEFKDSRKHTRPCPGCGSHSHGQPSSGDRPSKCPAWGQECNNCHIVNHYSRVCRQKRQHRTSDEAHALIAHVHYEKDTDRYTSLPYVSEIPAIVRSAIPRKQHQENKVTIFPDTRASICLAGPEHLRMMNLSMKDLTPCIKQVTAVGGSRLICRGWTQVTFNIFGHTTTQPVYFCDKVDRFYFSRQGCAETNIIHDSFLYPADTDASAAGQSEATVASNDILLPTRPTQLPFPPTDSNVLKLEKFLKDSFAESAFNKACPFPSMTGPPAHIHLRKDAIPHARHVPIPTPIHWRSEVKKALDDDVKRGILKPVSIGEPTEWCSPMVVTSKKNGKHRRTVDLQKLNTQCLRETHHCPSPFRAASQIPPNSKKTILDAVDGFHSILLDESSQPLTTFITEWGRYQYLRLPQGYRTASDAFTRRYDEVIKNVKRKIKVIDDTLLHDATISDAFWHTWDYLELCARNGIVINLEKFKFCRDEVEFAGLKIDNSRIAPSDHIISAIRDFPTPKSLTDARSWFGVVNQVAWAYATSPIMLPFRELVKPKSKFYWDSNLEIIFHKSKQMLIDKVIHGVESFDPTRRTCLQTDWSKQGIGYLLLQQYCKCTSDTPVCCTDGWKLVYAGSRFTHETEARYAPSEGEALAISWALNHAKFFVLGCTNLLVVTDHKPLLGLFNDRDLDSVNNTRLRKFKENTFRFRFQMQYCPGKWHKGPDACSRNPVASLLAISDKLCDHEQEEINEMNNLLSERCDHVLHIINEPQLTTMGTQDCSITFGDIQKACISDNDYASLVSNIQNGFKDSLHKVDPKLREFLKLRDRLSVYNSVALLDQRIIVPQCYRKQILRSLHCANQGAHGMQARANRTVYWPGMTGQIKNHVNLCESCIRSSPSHQKEPLIPSEFPEWPFQQVCADYFEVHGHEFLTIVDRYSSWINIYDLAWNEFDSKKLISICRSLFMNYGVPEELASDGGPQFTSKAFQKFLSDWGVAPRLSSAHYPQSNGRAEAAVKIARRIIEGNTSHNGTLDTDRAARAILQHRNTPLNDTDLSPAQILFHRQLRDQIPSQPQHYHLNKEWLIKASLREASYTKKMKTIAEKYNAHAKELGPLTVGTTVVVQGKHKKWTGTGVIVETLPYRKYNLRMLGSNRICLRNRRFLKALPPPPPIPPHVNSPEVEPTLVDIPRALKKLRSFNKPGISEQNDILAPRRSRKIDNYKQNKSS